MHCCVPPGPTRASTTKTGLPARCLQHEVDHLDGIVYLDRLPDHERDNIMAAAQDGSTNGP